MHTTAVEPQVVSTGPIQGRAPLRFVTAASLFDGHDAAINVMRRLIQAHGAEVIHLGHNRGVEEIVRAAIQEDADAIALSSYQGGHLEFFKYAVDMFRERGADHIRIFGGGGGTITRDEVRELEAYGVERIYRPDDGLRAGLAGMIADVIARARRASDARSAASAPPDIAARSTPDDGAVTRVLSHIEAGGQANLIPGISTTAPVVGVTGTGGAGKSSVVDELLLRFLNAFPDLRIAVLAVDPTRRRTGGALLGDRIRMNALRSDRVFMRSMATRRQHAATTPVLKECVAFLRRAGYGLVIVETAGIGQSDSEIVDLVDVAVYVMTSEYGAPSQLEKIDMLDYADVVVLNKYDKRGAEDALRDVRKQWKRNRTAFALTDDAVPVYPTIASQFNDPGMTWMFVNLCRIAGDKVGAAAPFQPPLPDISEREPRAVALIPSNRGRYLAEIAEQARAINRAVEAQVAAASRAHSLWTTLDEVDAARPAALEPYADAALRGGVDATLSSLRAAYQAAVQALSADAVTLLREWPERLNAVTQPQYAYNVRGRQVEGTNYVESLSHQQIPKIAPPRFQDWGELLRFLMRENLPGAYPYTAGVYPYRRTAEEPTRMFAGEGTPERTNRRFHYLAAGQSAPRLSTAFDSVTLYGEDPHPRPDVFGKVGNSGVSVATLDDMKKLYSGFDLLDPATSVSMTINGPAPMILAMFLNTAIDQAVEKYLREDPARWDAARARIAELQRTTRTVAYAGTLPEGHSGLGLPLLGLTGDQLVEREIYERIKSDTLRAVRGTVQADILKEDQAQNTCIFSTGFALKLMGDIQEYFIEREVRNFYSISISGYHIAEAGANPITQLAFTLANGFTIVEYYLARGMRLDDFAPNLSFFFSNGMDAEYAVLGRVARRVWARAMAERYGANARSQMLKYHIQTSGRSLHAQDVQFNDIRTTLQALYALLDNCNSLHTNAYDEAVTTPTEESVRRAVAIQLIINRELGLNACENALQGSFFIEALTDTVEEAVYKEFEAISERGGVLGAMDTLYQRMKIQEESLLYEQKKHDGSLPLIGVNTFLPRTGGDSAGPRLDLIRSTAEEREQQIAAVQAFRARRNPLAPAGATLGDLQQAASARRNVFAVLMDVVKYYSLGQISGALYDVGGEYRRNM